MWLASAHAAQQRTGFELLHLKPLFGVGEAAFGNIGQRHRLDQQRLHFLDGRVGIDRCPFGQLLFQQMQAVAVPPLQHLLEAEPGKAVPLSAMFVREMILQPLAERLALRQPGVMRSVIAVEDVHSALLAKVRDVQLGRVFPLASEQAERVPLPPAGKPVDFIGVPKQAERMNRRDIGPSLPSAPSYGHPTSPSERHPTAFPPRGGRCRPAAPGPRDARPKDNLRTGWGGEGGASTVALRLQTLSLRTGPRSYRRVRRRSNRRRAPWEGLAWS